MNNKWDNKNLIKVLKNGGVVIMPTDTIYGIVGSALNSPTVERIYDIRKRAPEKPCIILIRHVDELINFNITISQEQKSVLNKYWSFGLTKDFQPSPVSIIFDCLDESLEYLHCGTNSLAFRLPINMDLQKLLQETGPLIAPSANPEGLPTAQNIQEAQKYFNNKVDLYIDGGEIFGKASKVIKLHKDGSVSIIRE